MRRRARTATAAGRPAPPSAATKPCAGALPPARPGNGAVGRRGGLERGLCPSSIFVCLVSRAAARARVSLAGRLRRPGRVGRSSRPVGGEVMAANPGRRDAIRGEALLSGPRRPRQPRSSLMIMAGRPPPAREPTGIRHPSRPVFLNLLNRRVPAPRSVRLAEGRPMRLKTKAGVLRARAPRAALATAPPRASREAAGPGLPARDHFVVRICRRVRCRRGLGQGCELAAVAALRLPRNRGGGPRSGWRAFFAHNDSCGRRGGEGVRSAGLESAEVCANYTVSVTCSRSRTQFANRPLWHLGCFATVVRVQDSARCVVMKTIFDLGATLRCANLRSGNASVLHR